MGIFSTPVTQNLFAAQVTLAWDPVTDSSLQGYRVHYGSASKNYTATINTGNATSYAITGLGDGVTYYFAITAYNASAESAFSNEVAYTTPQACTNSLSSNGASYASSGGAGNVTVNAPSGCTWGSSNVPSWMNLTSGATGTGNGTIAYSIAPNSDVSSRSASLAIAGQVFTVTQDGLPTYTITASTGAGGSITPAGAITVAQGGSQSVAITSSPGYYIGDVQVDSSSIGAVTSYTFADVAANHSISATFMVTSCTITASANSGGRLYPSGAVNVGCGSSQTFTISRYPGYIIEDVKVDGVSVGPVTSYTFPNVNAGHSIAALFSR